MSAIEKTAGKTAKVSVVTEVLENVAIASVDKDKATLTIGALVSHPVLGDAAPKICMPTDKVYNIDTTPGWFEAILSYARPGTSSYNITLARIDNAEPIVIAVRKIYKKGDNK